MFYYCNQKIQEIDNSNILDVIEIADPRYPGGTSAAVAQELTVLNRAGFKIAFIPFYGSNLNVAHKWNKKIKYSIKNNKFSKCKLENGSLRSQLAIFHNPQTFKNFSYNKISIDSDKAIIVAHHPPSDFYNSLYFDPVNVEKNIKSYVNCELIWAPISQICRDSFYSSTFRLKLLNFDWSNLFDENEWQKKEYSLSLNRNKPVIGRHTRPHFLKWPDNIDSTLLAYPDKDDYDVRVLGWKDNLLPYLKKPPNNWTVFKYNSIPVNNFLKQIDFYVYFHHPSWRESFGRNIAEAILSGIPCILQHNLRHTFGGAAIYSYPHEVKNIVQYFCNNIDLYYEHANRAREIFISKCRSDIFIKNLIKLIEFRSSLDDEKYIVYSNKINKADNLVKRISYKIKQYT